MDKTVKCRDRLAELAQHEAPGYRHHPTTFTYEIRLPEWFFLLGVTRPLRSVLNGQEN
jgi:hypothetical protein